ncbi:hypothetical protein MMC25_004108 [Agyrium rufum]|nr:hypothetical protein [Agyrium rufum]
MPTIACLNGTSRALVNLTTLALSQGYSVKALVRSKSRYHAKVPPQKNLTVHEYSASEDTAALAEILKDVDTVYIALTGPDINVQSNLNQDAVHAICGALVTGLFGPGARSQTKVVLLSAMPVAPQHKGKEGGLMMRIFEKKILNHQYDDLTRAQDFLRKQSSWLDWVSVTPGLIVDTVEGKEVETQFRLSLTDMPEGAISYRRLGAALLTAGAEDKEGEWVGKFVSPIATEKPVKMGWQGMETQRQLLKDVLSMKILPWLMKMAVYGAVFAAAGYAFGVRESGTFLQERFSIALK